MAIKDPYPYACGECVKYPFPYQIPDTNIFPASGVPTNYPNSNRQSVSREEFERLRQELAELKELLKNLSR